MGNPRGVIGHCLRLQFNWHMNCGRNSKSSVPFTLRSEAVAIGLPGERGIFCFEVIGMELTAEERAAIAKRIQEIEEELGRGPFIGNKYMTVLIRDSDTLRLGPLPPEGIAFQKQLKAERHAKLEAERKALVMRLDDGQGTQNEKGETRKAVDWCYKQLTGTGPGKMKRKVPIRTLAAEAQSKYFPELTGQPRAKKIDSIRNSLKGRLPKRKRGRTR